MISLFSCNCKNCAMFRPLRDLETTPNESSSEAQSSKHLRKLAALFLNVQSLLIIHRRTASHVQMTSVQDSSVFAIVIRGGSQCNQKQRNHSWQLPEANRKKRYARREVGPHAPHGTQSPGTNDPPDSGWSTVSSLERTPVTLQESVTGHLNIYNCWLMWAPKFSFPFYNYV